MSSPRLALPSSRVLRIETLAGLVTALALIPEVISFSVLAGVDPQVGLFTSFVLSAVIAVTGGRPAMITAAAGAVALVVAPLVRDHGVDHLVAAVLLGGLLQILLGVAGAARLMRFVPRSVMVGFVNALAILIFTAQLRHVVDVPWAVYPIVAVTVVVMLVLPRLTTAIPAPLVAIAIVTAAVVAGRTDVPTVGDEGSLPRGLPLPGLPDVPLTLGTLQVVAPYAVAIALVGLMESLLTAKLVDDITDTPSDKTRESWGLGVANVAAGLFGGMGGCAMIGQTMVNVKVGGGRTRLSTFLAGGLLLVLVLLLGPVVAAIPMAALAAVMMVVSATTFDWHSVRPATLRMMPRSETFVMLTTVAVVVATRNLAYGVVAGVLVACLLFARRVAHLVDVTTRLEDDGATRVHAVHGAVFFASSNDLVHRFDYTRDAEGAPARVVIDMSDAQIWDASAVAALDAVVTRYAAHGIPVEITGLDDASERMHARLAGRFPSAA